MRINFYDTRVTDDYRTVLKKEKGVNYAYDDMNSPEEVVKMMNGLVQMDRLAEEYAYMVALNTSGRVLGLFFLSKGTVNTSIVNPREVFIRAILIGAVQIILIHNHPSGNPVPSSTDRELTKRLKDGGNLLGIPLLDHIVIGRNCFVSFKNLKIL